ncbi:MAG: hypothetical protein HKN35_15145 [Woeseia sp.]|nr:hypothetical protein [Woeseia sp.]NNE62230.1 hypothetical protein [Woeseia sp.]NNL55920.1 hypothetical protein [Woeseia sp.]
MSDTLHCFSCGASLEAMSLPLSRQDQCPQCSRYLHVCRMCEFFDAQVARQCREDDAEEVMDKEKPNFCDWFKPTGGRFEASGHSAAKHAEQQLDALFGESDAAEADADNSHKAADDLFR